MVAHHARARTVAEDGVRTPLTHEALSMANKVIGADRFDGRGYRIRAEIYESLGQREAAIADFHEVLRLGSFSEDVKIAHEVLGRLGSE